MSTKDIRDDDVASQCGSISGETFSSRRRNVCTLKMHSIEGLAQRLRDHHFDEGIEAMKQKKRFNKSFHYLRMVAVMFGGFATGSMMILRYNITVAILNMVNQTALYMHEHPNKTIEDFLDEGYSPGGEFDWDNEIQHMIMSWYMIAYTVPQVPATKLASKIGARFSVPISLMICAVSSLLTPTICYYGWQWVIVLRMINAAGASAVMPMMLNIIESWMPFEEISLGLTLAQMLLATMVACNPLIAGFLCSYHWSYAFYVPSVVVLIFCCLWIIIITDSPDDNWLVSSRELETICGCAKSGMEHMMHIHKFNKNNDTKSVRKPKDESPPENQARLIDVLKLPSLYAYMFIWMFYCSSFSTFSFILPTYLRQFLKISVAKNGIYCFIVQTGGLVAVLWPHPVLSFLKGRLNLSQTAAQRIIYVFVCITVAATWIYVGAFHEFQILLLFLNRCFQQSNDIIVTGSMMSNFSKVGLSGIVFSVVNTIGNSFVVVVSTLTGYVLDYMDQSREGWMMIYSGLGICQLIMMLVFTTIISSGPIEFKKSRASNEVANEDPEAMEREKSSKQNENGSVNNLTINKNNFDKLKQIESNKYL